MRPSDLVPSIHADVELALVMALAKRAEDRFGGAAVLAAQPWGRRIVDPGRISESERRELP